MSLTRWLLALFGAVLVASVVGGAVLVAVVGETDVQPGRREVAAWDRCRSEALGYSIAYPAGWHTDGKCSFFDPEPFTVPENSDFYGTALEVQVPQESFENIVRGFTDERFARTISRRDVIVGGRRAVLAESEATGEGLFERGFRTYAYVVDVPGRPPIVVQATRAPGTEWAGRRAIADRAVRSLQLFAPAQDELPFPVAEKRDAIVAAARARDYDALAALVDPKQFTYSFGGPFPGGPAAYWREAARSESRDPLPILAAVLALPYTKDGELYIWPFAYDRNPKTLTPAERRQLSAVATERELESWATAGSYYGWRVGITADGRWTFFVAGD